MQKQGRKRRNPFESVKIFQHSFTMGDETLTQEQRFEYLNEAGKTAEALFKEQIIDLHKALLETNPIHVLSHLSFYLLHSRNPAPDEWKNPDRFFPHHLEVLQALVLKHGWAEFAMKRTDPAAIIDGVKSVSQLFIAKRMQTAKVDFSEAERNAFTMREAVRTHTQAVRNWSYPQHMHEVIRSLMSRMDKQCEAEYGISASVCADLLFKLVDVSEFRLNEFNMERAKCLAKKSKREIFDAYKECYPHCQWLEESETLIERKDVSIKQFRNHLWITSDFLLPAFVFLYRPEQVQILLDDDTSVETIKRLLNLWSFEFGAVNIDDEHIFMGNPVLERPFIKTMDDFYLLPMPGLLISFGLQMLEQLFSREDLKEQYEEARAKFLEDELARLMSEGFPHATVYRGSLWECSEDGKTYENDALVILGSLAFVCEAKGGKVAPSARRGGDRLAKEVRELLIEPSQQAARFIQYLSKTSGPNEFKTKSGKINKVDLSGVTRFVPITVTLDELSIRFDTDVLTDVARKAKGEEITSSFLLSDLMIVLDVLDSEPLRAHYLVRRDEFYKRRLNLLGDELDVLAVYMKARLLVDVPKEALYLVAGEAHPIDEYYLRSYEGMEAVRPEFPLTARWKYILNRVASLDVGWERFEVLESLVDTQFKDQKGIEKTLQKLARKVRSGKEKYMSLTFKNGFASNALPIIFVVLPNAGDLKEMFFDGLEAARLASGCERVIGFGLDAHDLDKPYLYFGLT